MNDDLQSHFESQQRAWDDHDLSQLKYFRSLALRDKLEAVQGMADVVRRFQRMRAQGEFRAAPHGSRPSANLNDIREPAAQHGSNGDVHDLVLSGCRPEPLMNYLKGLGVLRLVSEQADPTARGFWRNDEFVLRSKLDRDALLDFLLRSYIPTPIVVPWSGNDFFAVKTGAKKQQLKKTPSGSTVLEAFAVSATPRLASYRQVINDALTALARVGITKKEQMKGSRKTAYLADLRSRASGSIVPWLDAAAVMETEKATFSALLGSGGSSDGNTHFSDNFMQNLWDTLPDFDTQRAQKSGKKNGDDQPNTCLQSTIWLRGALFTKWYTGLIDKRTSSLFDAGGVGGANATQGMERDAVLNPWNFILALEGVICFAGAMVKRSASGEQGHASFPFQFRATVADNDRLADKEFAGRELWLPLWRRPSRFAEIAAVFAEGRVEIGARGAIRSVEAARAAASFGIDRGITAFQRYAVLKGRVGGENYNTSASLGRFKVNAKDHVDLLREIDAWLYRFCAACKTGQKEAAPARLTSALRRIDSAIFDYCRYGGNVQFQSILIALGRAERELMRDGLWADKVKPRVPPIMGLSPEWIAAANDVSPEFNLALTVAGIRGSGNIGSLRTNLEPARSGRRKDGEPYASWIDKDRAVVWNAADLPANLAAVLARRIRDAHRSNDEHLPLWSSSNADLNAIAAFLAGEIDDRRLEELLWGLMLIEWSADAAKALFPLYAKLDAPPLPRLYALLKPLFLHKSIVYASDHWRYARLKENGIVIRPESRILPLLRAGRVPEAARIAAQRLRSSGLVPMAIDHTESWGEVDGERLASALLFPVNSWSLDRLLRLVIRNESIAAKLEGSPHEH